MSNKRIAEREQATVAADKRPRTTEAPAKAECAEYYASTSIPVDGWLRPCQ